VARERWRRGRAQATGGGGGANGLGPVDRETRERQPARKARTKRENVFPVKTRPTCRLGGPAGMVSTCGGSEASGLAGPEAAWAAWSAEPKIR
jgi:hypothetical protein